MHSHLKSMHHKGRVSKKCGAAVADQLRNIATELLVAAAAVTKSAGKRRVTRRALQVRIRVSSFLVAVPSPSPARRRLFSPTKIYSVHLAAVFFQTEPDIFMDDTDSMHEGASMYRRTCV